MFSAALPYRGPKLYSKPTPLNVTPPASNLSVSAPAPTPPPHQQSSTKTAPIKGKLSGKTKAVPKMHTRTKSTARKDSNLGSNSEKQRRRNRKLKQRAK
ncbi:MAG: hypothetical protein MMC33_001413 [Icmadophila ericetorum]|nr:hypothetical protein [Icmadophila ericetorum]